MSVFKEFVQYIKEDYKKVVPAVVMIVAFYGFGEIDEDTHKIVEAILHVIGCFFFGILVYRFCEWMFGENE